MKKIINNVTAIVSLALGHVLVYIDFILSESHIIHEPTLWYFGQCCVLFGTVIGVIRYVDRKTSLNSL